MTATEGRLVERERELATLGGVVEAARRGDGGAAAVEGPAGIGKSRLLDAAAASAGELRVLRARASELEREFPFGVVRQLFEPVLFGADSEERERLLAGAGGLAERVLVASAAEGGGADVYASLHGLYWFAANLAGSRPVLLLVDDAQWSDADSLRWLAFLLRRLEGVPLALVVAVRAGEGGGEEALLDELVSDPILRVITPGVLSDEGVGSLIEGALGAAPAGEFLTACQRATGGNPFLVRELLRELAERGASATAGTAPLVEQLSSSGVGRAVRARLRRLVPGCLELARAVSVLGDGCELAAAARLAELDERAAARAADALAGASILEPEERLVFVHPLVRSSVYGELGPAERSAWHERAARLLAQGGVPPDRVALHLLAAAPRGDRELVETLRSAAREASARSAPDAALAFLRRASEEPPPPELRATVERELGMAALRGGEIELAIERLRAATRGLRDAGERAHAADALSSALFLANRSDEAMAELTAVIDELPDSEREQGLRLQATRWVAPRVSTAAWRRLLQTGDRFEVRGGSARTTGERLALAVGSLHAVRRRTAAEAIELAERALSDGTLLEDPGPESAGFWLAPLVLMWAGALERASAVTDEVITWARRHGSLPAFSMATGVRACLRWLCGALDDAEADAASALEHHVPGFSPYGHFALANVLLARGHLDEVDELLSQPPFEPGSPSRSIFYYLQTRARLRTAQRRPEEALDDLFACERFEREWEIETPAACNWRADAVPLLAALERHEDARALAEAEHERCRTFAASVPLSAALRTLATLDPGPVGIRLLEQSVSVLEGSPARLERAHALIALGVALRHAGRRADAREPLREGLELTVECGASVVATRAHDELVAAGARPRRDPIESRSTLTASELRVARMAAEGMTNREIAQALFLTEKTIEVHLTRTYRKLDIQSRSQLIRALPATSAA